MRADFKRGEVRPQSRSQTRAGLRRLQAPARRRRAAAGLRGLRPSKACFKKKKRGRSPPKSQQRQQRPFSQTQAASGARAPIKARGRRQLAVTGHGCQGRLQELGPASKDQEGGRSPQIQQQIVDRSVKRGLARTSHGRPRQTRPPQQPTNR